MYDNGRREGELYMPPTHRRYDYSSIPIRPDYNRESLLLGVVPG